MHSIAYLNGQFMPIEEARVPVDDRGYIFGDGIYEVVMAFYRQPFAMDDHLQRWTRSLAALRLTCPYTPAQLQDIIREAIARVEGDELLVYFQLTRGVSPRMHTFPPEGTPGTFLLTVRPHAHDARAYALGDDAVLAEDIRWHRCDIKSLNLIPNVMALQQAAERGCTQAIFHRGDIVTECGSSNAYIVQGGRILTHPLTQGILGGTTRAHILALAAGLGMPVEERAFTVDALYAADEAFSSSVAARPVAIVRVEGRAIGTGKPGPVVRALQAGYRGLIAAQCGREA